jgi:hypothetical protein
MFERITKSARVSSSKNIHRTITVSLILILIHIVLVVASSRLPAAIAPLIAGSVYLPLWPLSAVGLPVFSSAASGGWASPSLLGWFVFVAIWSLFWWGLIALIVRVRSL